MNIWLAAGVVLVVLLAAIVLFGARRPRRAEELLGQLQHEPSVAGKSDAIKPQPFADVLTKIKLARLTGTLNVTSGDRTASLYFLFGRLFHAVNLSLSGEAAVRECLAWPDAHCAFDRVSPLPTVETIERPIDQVLAG
jgi:hypothetical protein